MLKDNKGSAVNENGALNGFSSRDDAAVLLTFMISKKLSNIIQNSAVELPLLVDN